MYIIRIFVLLKGVLPETVTKPLASFVKNKEFKNVLTSIVSCVVFQTKWNEIAFN